MSIQKLTTLITNFADGETPIGSEFEDFITSLRHKWDNYIYAGLATVSGTPADLTQQVWYFASAVGTYTNYGGLAVAAGELAVFKLTINQTTGIGTWSKDTILTGVGSTLERRGTKVITAGANTVTYLTPLSAAATVIIPHAQDAEGNQIAGTWSNSLTTGFTFTAADAGTLYYIASI